MSPEEEAREIVRRGYSGDMDDDSWLEMPASEMIKAVAKAIAAEREACAKIVEGEVVAERYRTWSYMHGVGNRSHECEITRHSDKLADAIRNRN